MVLAFLFFSHQTPLSRYLAMHLAMRLVYNLHGESGPFVGIHVFDY